MAYSHTTYAAAKTQLSEMLGDTGKVFWTDAELGVYIIESLRTWNALTGHWRSKGQFATTSGVAFYDLGIQMPSLRGMTVTDSSLVSAIQYHLLEPSTGTSWTGTDQFTLAEVSNAMQRRRNQLLAETGIVLTRTAPVLMPGPPVSRVELADTVVDVRRLAWSTPESYVYPMWREDEWALVANDPVWPQNPDRPVAYSVTGTPPLFVQVAPPPIDAGTLDMLAVNTGAALPATGVVLGVPDDLAWVVKFGALADLLGKDGPGKDIPRAQYCEMRWAEGLSLARLATSIIQSYVNEVPVWTEPISSLDALDPNWQNVQGSPSVVGQSGVNLVGLSKVPDAVYGMSFDLVRNAPVPVADGTQLEIGREHLDALLSYAQHLASFKMGGAEFEATTIHYSRMLRLASMQNEKLRANARYFTALHDKAAREESFRPRRAALIQ